MPYSGEISEWLRKPCRVTRSLGGQFNQLQRACEHFDRTVPAPIRAKYIRLKIWL